jgi:hypothetical protein
VQIPTSLVRGSARIRMGVSGADAPASGDPIPTGASFEALTLLSTLQAAVHARTQTAHA